MSTNKNFVSDAPAQFSFPLPLRERDRVRGDETNQAPSPLFFPVRDCVATHRNLIDVMLSKAKHRAFFYKVEILRLSPQDDIATQSLKAEEVVRIAIARVLTLLLVGVILLACGPADAQTREKVRVALGSISVNTSVIPVGHQYGMFAKYGVDLEPIYMGGGMNSLAAVTSNTVQFLSAGSTATISAHLGGIDIVMLTVQSNKLDYSVFAAPEIKSPQD